MNTREQTELENAALANELSRQVAHEFSNFVYNLFLRIEIAENSQNSQPFDWQHVKQESRKMASLLQQWERFHSRTLAGQPVEVDLHELIRRSVSEAAPLSVELAPLISAESLRIVGCALEVKHLLRLLLEEAFLSQSGDRNVSVRTETIHDRAVVRISVEGGRFASDDREADTPSLLAAACRSLAVRLEAAIQREQRGRQRVVSVDFPMR